MELNSHLFDYSLICTKKMNDVPSRPGQRHGGRSIRSADLHYQASMHLGEFCFSHFFSRER